jgi:hypothetical protein
LASEAQARSIEKYTYDGKTNNSNEEKAKLDDAVNFLADILPAKVTAICEKLDGIDTTGAPDLRQEKKRLLTRVQDIDCSGSPFDNNDFEAAEQYNDSQVFCKRTVQLDASESVTLIAIKCININTETMFHAVIIPTKPYVTSSDRQHKRERVLAEMTTLAKQLMVTYANESFLQGKYQCEERISEEEEEEIPYFHLHVVAHK